MRLDGKVAVITGAAGGIGSALARRFAAEGAAGVVLSDVDHEGASAIAADIVASGGKATAIAADVADEAAVAELVAASERAFGSIDLFCSNAGIASGSGLDASPEDWSRSWSVNVLAHAHAAKAVLPSMIERGTGYLLQTVSAAGLLSTPGDAPYTATKHAALGLAEWLSMTYGNLGIKVSVLCPMGVRTNMLMPGVEAGHPSAVRIAAMAPIVEPAQVAEDVVKGIDEERFLILPHPEVGVMYAKKAADPDRWLASMQRHYGEQP